jgi:hypothetical protein
MMATELAGSCCAKAPSEGSGCNPTRATEVSLVTGACVYEQHQAKRRAFQAQLTKKTYQRRRRYSSAANPAVSSPGFRRCGCVSGVGWPVAPVDDEEDVLDGCRLNRLPHPRARTAASAADRVGRRLQTRHAILCLEYDGSPYRGPREKPQFEGKRAPESIRELKFRPTARRRASNRPTRLLVGFHGCRR